MIVVDLRVCCLPVRVAEFFAHPFVEAVVIGKAHPERLAAIGAEEDFGEFTRGRFFIDNLRRIAG